MEEGCTIDGKFHNLEVENFLIIGETTVINTINTSIKDNLLELNKDVTINSSDIGIIMNRGITGNSALFMWDETEDEFALGTTTSNANSTGNLNITLGDLNLSTLNYSTLNETSDSRIKFNKKKINGDISLNIINKLKPTYYEKILKIPKNFKDWLPKQENWENEKNNYEWKKCIGLIAQDVKNIEELNFSVKGSENNSLLNLNYQDIFCYHIEATKELNLKVETQINNINNLKLNIVDINDLILELENKLNNNHKLDNLENNLKSNNNSILSLENNYSKNILSIDLLKKDIDKNNDDILNINIQNNNLSSDIIKNKDNIGNIFNRINNLNSDIIKNKDIIINITNKNQLKNKELQDNINNEIRKINPLLNNLENKLTKSLNNNINNINIINKDLENKKNNIETILKQTKNFETNINTLEKRNENIKKLENNYSNINSNFYLLNNNYEDFKKDKNKEILKINENIKNNKEILKINENIIKETNNELLSLTNTITQHNNEISKNFSNIKILEENIKNIKNNDIKEINENHTNSISNILTSIDKNIKNIKNIENNYNDISDKLNLSTVDINKLQNEFNVKNSEQQNLEIKVNKNIENISKNEHNITILQKDIETIKPKIDDIQENNVNEKNKLINVSDKVINQDKNIKTLDENINELKDNLKNSNTKIDLLKYTFENYEYVLEYDYKEDITGLIVSSIGSYNLLTDIKNKYLPILNLSKLDNDIKVFGIIDEKKNNGRYKINNLKHNFIWVCNKNGVIVNGDYITSSSVTGYGMKQNNNKLLNSTIAKITCNCNFNQINKKIKIIDNKLQYDNESNIIFEETIDNITDNKRFLDNNGLVISEENYNIKKNMGELVYIACLVGCSYI